MLRLRDPVADTDTGVALGLTTDGNHRWCATDPRRGTALVVAEAVMNLACVGAEPLALVNCLNFGNPEHPEVMWQLSEAIDGMAEACRAFGVPVIGGNVSLYNEVNGIDIDPSPVVGVLGRRTLPTGPLPGTALRTGWPVVLLGSAPAGAGLAGSRFAWELLADRSGRVADLDHAGIDAVAALVRGLVVDGVVGAVHDVAEGGLAVALAEMAMAGATGLLVTADLAPLDLLVETPGRVVVATAPHRLQEVAEAATAAGVVAAALGTSGGDVLRVAPSVEWTVAELAAAAASTRL